MRIIIAFVIGLLLAVLTSPAIAGNCRQFFRVHHAVQQVVVAPVGYGVGSDIALDSVVRRAIREELGKLNLSQPQQQNAASVDTSILVAKCARCHGGASPAGALLIDGTADFPPDALRSWMLMAARGDNVPDKMKPVMSALKPEDVAAITDALLGK